MPIFPIVRLAVRGESMEPAFREGQYVLVNRWARKFSSGNVVVLRDPREPQREILKRILKIEGGEYVVSGDNRTESTDSRTFGSVSGEHIIGKVLMRI